MTSLNSYVPPYIDHATLSARLDAQARRFWLGWMAFGLLLVGCVLVGCAAESKTTYDPRPMITTAAGSVHAGDTDTTKQTIIIRQRADSAVSMAPVVKPDMDAAKAATVAIDHNTATNEAAVAQLATANAQVGTLESDNAAKDKKIASQQAEIDSGWRRTFQMLLVPCFALIVIGATAFICKAAGAFSAVTLLVPLNTIGIVCTAAGGVGIALDLFLLKYAALIIYGIAAIIAGLGVYLVYKLFIKAKANTEFTQTVENFKDEVLALGEKGVAVVEKLFGRGTAAGTIETNVQSASTTAIATKLRGKNPKAAVKLAAPLPVLTVASIAAPTK